MKDVFAELNNRVDASQFQSVSTKTFNGNADTTGLRANVKEINVEEMIIGTLEQLARAEVKADEDYRALLLDYTYEEVLAKQGPREGFYPCDDYTGQCTITCPGYGNCPKEQKPVEEKKETVKHENSKVSNSSTRSSSSNSSSNSQRSKRKKSKK